MHVEPWKIRGKSRCHSTVWTPTTASVNLTQNINFGSNYEKNFHLEWKMLYETKEYQHARGESVAKGLMQSWKIENSEKILEVCCYTFHFHFNFPLSFSSSSSSSGSEWKFLFQFAISLRTDKASKEVCIISEEALRCQHIEDLFGWTPALGQEDIAGINFSIFRSVCVSGGKVFPIANETRDYLMPYNNPQLAHSCVGNVVNSEQSAESFNSLTAAAA